jgi:hypothetical protein
MALLSISKRRIGLTQSVTTLILLVLSVLLASGTIGLYTLSVTTSAMKTEQLVIRSIRIWADPSGAQVALNIENIGGRDALITSIEVGYVEDGWDSVFYAEGEARAPDVRSRSPFLRFSASHYYHRETRLDNYRDRNSGAHPRCSQAALP